MADISENEKTDKTPLLKQKKPRPPQSEKQMQNFRAMQEIRAKKAEERKQAKILEAQRALLQKEGYVKANPTPAPKEEPVQFEIEEEEEEEKVVQPKVKAAARKVKEIQTPKAQIRKVAPRVIKPESEDEGDSDSSDEVIIIKRKSKKSAAKRNPSPMEDEEEEYVANTPQPDYSRFFC
jgi:hypothetical protein